MILQGDCRDVLPTLAAESIQCCVTSPPYWGLRDYGCDGQLGLEATPEEYVANMVQVFREVRRVLRPDGTVWLNLGDSFASGSQGWRAISGEGSMLQGGKANMRATNRNGTHRPPGLKPKDLIGIPWRVAFALQSDGWWLRSDIIWSKPNPMPESVTDRPTKAHEYVFLLTKAERYFYDAAAIAEPVSESTLRIHGSPNVTTEKRGSWKTEVGNVDGLQNGASCIGDGTRNVRSVWSIPTKPFTAAHFAVMPEELARRCIMAGSSAKGCCPECGAPWERVVEREPYQPRGEYRKHAGESGHNNPTGKTPGSNTRGMPFREVLDTGWRPTCHHEAEPVPCTVLDPFAGAGTTCYVAKEHGRNFIGIELNPEYIGIAEKRMAQEVLELTA